MLTLDLSTLRGPELRRLLDTTRQRGQAKLSYEILREMAARRERTEGRRTFSRRQGGEPHEINLELGDPLDRADDDVGDEDMVQLGEVFVDEPLEAAAVEPDEPIYLHSDHEPEAYAPPPRSRQGPPPGRGGAAPRRWLWVTVGIAIGLFVGVAIGGWADGVSREPRLPASKAPDTVQVATLAPAAPAPAAEAPAPSPSAPIVDDSISPATAPANTASDIASAPAVIQAPAPSSSVALAKPPTPAAPAKALAPSKPAVPSAPPPAATPALAAKAKAPAVPAGAEQDATMASIEADLTKPAKATAAAAGASATLASAKGACAGQPTPADKTICETPRLQRLQRDLRQAYADALDAHQDRDTLRERQLAWRDSRNTVTDPDRLVRLYEERIRKLNAAAEEARAER